MNLFSLKPQSTPLDSVTAIILAAGLGTRMKSDRSKLLHTILDEPLIHYPLHAALGAGIRHFIVVTGHHAQAVEAALAPMATWLQTQGMTLTYAHQEVPQGTGHAVQMAVQADQSAAQHYLIMCADSPHLTAEVLSDLQRSHAKHTPLITVLGATLPEPTGYGRLIGDAPSLSRIVEERAASATERQIQQVNAGCYVMDGAFVRSHIGRLTPHPLSQEYYLTDLIEQAAPRVRVCMASDPSVVKGVNSQFELLQARRHMSQHIVQAWCAQGVDIESDDVSVAPRVVLSPGVILERGVTLRGPCHIASGAHIEHHAHLKNMRIESAVRIKAYSYLEDSHIMAGATVGPMARLRSEAVIGVQAEVGNFCEIKKSHLAAHAKSHHVSYLGDATIGERTNIGAGTIICNYNGVHKPHSEIGADVFVGSNSTLIAPVQIESGAYIAAGSVITRPVPPESLAIGRAKQENKEGYVPRLKAKLKSSP